jgi:hypothetical protein
MILSKNKINSNNMAVEIKEGKKIKKEIFYLVMKLCEPIYILRQFSTAWQKINLKLILICQYIIAMGYLGSTHMLRNLKKL